MNAPDLSRPGRLSLAAGTLGLGLLSLVFADFAPNLQPLLAFIGDGRTVAYVSGGLLALAGAAMMAPGGPARLGAFVAGAVWLVWLILGHGSILRPDRAADVVAWVSLAEAASMMVVLFVLARREPSPRQLVTARIVVAAMLIWFGVVHFLFKDAIAGMIPEWMPAREMWPWVTAAANIAAGLSILTGVLGRWGSALVGLMFASWVFLVHIPRLVGAPGGQEEWTALALNLALVGVVWTVSAVALRRSA